jgi:hypothetical protein
VIPFRDLSRFIYDGGRFAAMASLFTARLSAW